MKMKKHQKVNKLPGSGYVTNKVNLATSNLPNIPKAFKVRETPHCLKFTPIWFRNSFFGMIRVRLSSLTLIRFQIKLNWGFSDTLGEGRKCH